MCCCATDLQKFFILQNQSSIRLKAQLLFLPPSGPVPSVLLALSVKDGHALTVLLVRGGEWGQHWHFQPVVFPGVAATAGPAGPMVVALNLG